MELKGSYTIEAALLMPLILGTIVILIYMSFFLHDRAVLREGAIILANRYSNEQHLSNDVIKQRLMEVSDEVINQKVIITKNIYTQITVKDKEIIVASSGEFQFPNMYIVGSIVNRHNFTISTNKVMKRLKPVDFIRACRIAQGLLNRQ